jgi:nucleoside-diphosphate-sugar epimerase
MKTALVLGAGGFIGTHLVGDLVRRGYFVRGVDLKEPEFSKTKANEFMRCDLRFEDVVADVFDKTFDEVYQLAADMGGAGYIFSGTHDADVIHNSALINLNVVERAVDVGCGKLFFSSSACAYPQENQTDPSNPKCSEGSCFPANPDSPYGWEKIFSEIVYDCFRRNKGLTVKIARFHNIFGELSPWRGGREKAPAALCRKIADVAGESVEIEVWGAGMQTRSFLYIEECLEGIRRLMENPDFDGPVNIGSEEMVTINELAYLIAEIAGKKITIKNVPGFVGVAGRNSDNRLIREKLGWAPSRPLRYGLTRLYKWVGEQVHGND